MLFSSPLVVGNVRYVAVAVFWKIITMIIVIVYPRFILRTVTLHCKSASYWPSVFFPSILVAISM